ncbi:unnamed protein product, partial [Meganyctiphanes norvegica]
MSLTDRSRSAKRSFTNKFKLDAVELAEKVGGNRTAAKYLGCSEKNIWDWKNQLAELKDAPEKKKSVKQKREGYWPEIERRVCAFIDERKSYNLRISREMIHLEAKKAAKNLEITDFKVSQGWCNIYMKRAGYHIRERCKVVQDPPHQFEDKITEFKKFVKQRLKDHNYQLVCIGNMDETLVNMDMIPRL